MKVLVFSSLYPNNMWPNHGIFVKERMTAVARTGLYKLRVVAPVPYFPPLRLGSRWRYSQVAAEEVIGEITVYHPKYFMVPKIGMMFYGILMFVSVLPFLQRLKREFDFELIDAHYVFPDGLAAVLLGQWFKIPVVVSARGSDINVFEKLPIIRRLIRWTLRRAHAVITVSQALKNVTVALGIPSEKITVVPNGVDSEKFSPFLKSDAREKLGLPIGEKKILLSVGHLTPNKGFDLLVKAMKILSEESKEDTPLLVIVGSGKYEKDLKRLIEAQGVQSCVLLVGAMPHDYLPWYYNAADVVCLMSEREGWPNVIVEALACGRPVVASRVGGIPEILTSHAVGILVERDVQHIAAGLKEALQRDWNVQKIVNHGRSFSWGETAQSLANIFFNVAGKKLRVDGI